MNNRRSRLSRTALEDLLEGRSERADTLSEVLSAARAPGMPHEVHGLDAAMACFATASPSAGAPEPERRQPVLKRLITAKVIGATVGALALGGVAVAAGTGNLPSPLPHSQHAASTASSHVPLSVPPVKPSATRGGPESTDSPTTAESSGSTESTAATTSATHTPTPSLPGLCRAWLSRPHTSGNADDSAAFAVLVRAAGNKDAVNGYCTSLLATAQPTHPTGKPSDVSGSQHGRPSDVPASTHRAGTPNPHSTSHPNKPMNPPSAVPSGPRGH